MRRGVWSGLGLLLAVILVRLDAQLFEVRRSPMPAGTALITGVVLTDEGGPAIGAKVSLHVPEEPLLFDGPVYAPLEVVADERGKFAIAHVMAGSFDLRAALPGFPEIEFGQVRPGLPGTPIGLADKSQVTVTLRFSRGASIAGVTLDHRGQPTPGVSVYAFRLEPMDDDGLLLGVGGSTESDGRGEYRIENLPPGNYAVLGYRTRPPTEQQPPLHQVGPGTWALESGGYYPDATTADAATRIALSGSEARAGITIHLTMNSVTTITGVVSHPDGRPASTVPVSLRPVGDQMLPSREATSDSDGRFELTRVVAGRYEVSALAMPEIPFVARSTVVSDGKTPQDVALILKPGATVSGRVVMDFSAPAERSTPVNVWLGRASGSSTYDTPGVPSVNTTGAFTFRGVPPGHYRFRGSRFRASRRVFPKSVMVNGRDALDFPFEITGDEWISDVVVTMTDRMPEVSGTVTDSGNKPSLNHTVVVFAADERFWAAGSRRIATVRPDTSGRYSVRGLAAGEYLVALGAADLFGRPSTSVLRTLRGSSTRVTLRDGERRDQNLRAR